MSSRLGTALAGHVLALPGKRKFVLVEGVSEDLAEAMAAAWDDSELRLAIASEHPERFGARALKDVAATGVAQPGAGLPGALRGRTTAGSPVAARIRKHCAGDLLARARSG